MRLATSCNQEKSANAIDLLPRLQLHVRSGQTQIGQVTCVSRRTTNTFRQNENTKLMTILWPSVDRMLHAFWINLGTFRMCFFRFSVFHFIFFCDKFQTKQLKWSAHEVKRLHYLDSFICWRNCCWSLQISVLAGRRMKSHQSWIHGTSSR